MEFLFNLYLQYFLSINIYILLHLNYILFFLSSHAELFNEFQAWLQSEDIRLNDDYPREKKGAFDSIEIILA